MNLEIEKLRLTDEELVAAVRLPGTKIPISVLATERKGADAATNKAHRGTMQWCIAELWKHRDSEHIDDYAAAKWLCSIAGQWQQALDAAKGPS